MKVITWNVDGLCGERTSDRTRTSLEIILSEAPDLVFLQEVIPSTERIFTDGLRSKGYRSAVDAPRGAPYFTMCYFNPMSVKTLGQGGLRLDYTGDAKSRMGRDILQMKCRHVSHPLSPNSSENNSDSPILSPPILVLNSHLESEKASSAVRTAQLIQLAKLMHGVKEEGGVALVAGDLNMRDKEAKQAVLEVREDNGDPSFDLNDAYVHFGKPKELSKTWIMPGKPMVGCRFDRVYHSCHNRNIWFESLEHVGTKVIPSVGMTPSDHFGLLLTVGLKRGTGSLASKDMDGGELAGLVLGAPKKGRVGADGKKRKADGFNDMPSAWKMKRLLEQQGLKCDLLEDGEGKVDDNDEDEEENLKKAILLSMQGIRCDSLAGVVLPDDNKTAGTEGLIKDCGNKAERNRARTGFLKSLDKRLASTPHVATQAPHDMTVSKACVSDEHEIIDLSDD